MKRIFFKKKPDQEKKPSLLQKFFGKEKADPFFSASSGAQTEKKTPQEDKVTGLSKDMQREMGAALGGDFSDVKIHSGPHSEKMNESMNSHAFTYGKDIYFNRNMFNEDTKQGKMLLAHELVHTMQQQKGTADADWSQDSNVETQTDSVAEGAMKTLRGGKEAYHQTVLNTKKNIPSTGIKVQRCARAPSVGPPTTWTIINPKVGPGPGGWKVSDTMGGFMARYPNPRNVQCFITIGVPIENHLGPVSDEFASSVSMAAIQTVGTSMQAELSAEDPYHFTPTALICKIFMERVQAEIQAAIPGARVSKTI